MGNIRSFLCFAEVWRCYQCLTQNEILLMVTYWALSNVFCSSFNGRTNSRSWGREASMHSHSEWYFMKGSWVRTLNDLTSSFTVVSLAAAWVEHPKLQTIALDLEIRCKADPHSSTHSWCHHMQAQMPAARGGMNKRHCGWQHPVPNFPVEILLSVFVVIAARWRCTMETFVAYTCF